MLSCSYDDVWKYCKKVDDAMIKQSDDIPLQNCRVNRVNLSVPGRDICQDCEPGYDVNVPLANEVGSTQEVLSYVF